MKSYNFLIILLLLCCYFVRYNIADNHKAVNCGPSLKTSSSISQQASNNTNNCESITTNDVLSALHWIAHPPVATKRCDRLTTVQGISVCEDYLPKDLSQCNIFSAIASTWCDHYGSLAFEMYWAERGCKVTLFHFIVQFKGNVCNNDNFITSQSNITLIRKGVWEGRCYNCFYKYLTLARNTLKSNQMIDVLKLQDREGVNEDYDGVQYTMLADIFIFTPEIMNYVIQVSLKGALNTISLVDNVGREAEHAWNIWASRQLLMDYASISTRTERGRNLPIQYDYLFKRVGLDTTIGSYYHTLVRLSDSKEINKNKIEMNSWTPNELPKLKAKVPSYCKSPKDIEEKLMQEWIEKEIKVRCHPTRLAVPCERNKIYEGFVPCQQELMNLLAEDYASLKKWCDFNHPAASIKPLSNVDPLAAKYFQRDNTLEKDKPKCGVRLAFFFTVYTDHQYFRRLIKHLYSTDHFYLIHIDPAGSTVEYNQEMNLIAKEYNDLAISKAERPNIFIVKDVPIVYGASTATILLTKAMAWFLQSATGWDYFLPLTGSDYPLVPLERIEKIFVHQKPPMPFVMAWTPGTSTHLFRLEKTHPVFEEDKYLAKSFQAVTAERGKILGQVPMEYRSSNFGPPLFCNNKSTFYHLDNRRNKSATISDTQWLFPRDNYPGRGKAYADEDPTLAIPAPDNVFRVWKKSDPATTGAYDLKTVEYIINSEEGRKYFHFFKQMLLGSEEHYYVSLLYNWPRTRAFIQTLSAEIVWNTWELGLWEQSGGGFQTHTHFLTLNEWDILVGFSMRGMMFARKFSSKKTAALLDKIDEFILFNKSTNAGLYWPGYFYTDVTTPGKEWVAQYRLNATLKAKSGKASKAPPKIYHENTLENSNKAVKDISNPTEKKVQSRGRNSLQIL